MLRKICGLLFAVLLCFSMYTPNAWASGAFSQTCIGISISGTQLSADCERINRRRSYTSIDLRDLIVNVDGQLTWSSYSDRWNYPRRGIGSDFTSTCQNIDLFDESKLQALCKKDDGSIAIPSEETTNEVDPRLEEIIADFRSDEDFKSSFANEAELENYIAEYKASWYSDIPKNGYSYLDLDERIANIDGVLKFTPY